MNLRPAIWRKPVLTQKQLKLDIKENREFQVCDIVNGYGPATTPAELRAMGHTHAQIRYGARLEKVWYGRL